MIWKYETELSTSHITNQNLYHSVSPPFLSFLLILHSHFCEISQQKSSTFCSHDFTYFLVSNSYHNYQCIKKSPNHKEFELYSAFIKLSLFRFQGIRNTPIIQNICSNLSRDLSHCRNNQCNHCFAKATIFAIPSEPYKSCSIAAIESDPILSGYCATYAGFISF